ncbi:MAG: hypothetical protein Sylvanvirus43_2 [Sylvanvirus sp.]|uniref:Uncharacterized protein n=1 Tax=Sylvanvirus sp. TaxID=2487774 RepID=A0A3G5AJ99_9VIRU|nr:MAG: hypothetical protein Sylvanvirus43_2 [Sylvanvirus sp.]
MFHNRITYKLASEYITFAESQRRKILALGGFGAWYGLMKLTDKPHDSTYSTDSKDSTKVSNVIHIKETSYCIVQGGEAKQGWNPALFLETNRAFTEYST